MKKLCIFICLQGIVLSLFGQTDYLLLTRKTILFKTKKIPEGTMVNIKPIISDRETLKGKLEILNDSTIAADGDTILVNNIKIIRVKNTASNVTGGFVTAASLGMTIYCIYMVPEMLPLDTEYYPLALVQVLGVILGVSAIVGGIIYTAVGIFILINGWSYKTFGRDAYSIRVVHDQTVIPSIDKLASQQLKY
jgi:hypothetical protein